MTEPADAPPADSWDNLLANLRRRFPGQKDSVLFCIHKLQQNPDLTLRDFRAEADLYGIPVAGRSLHSARALLGLIRTEASSAAANRVPAPSAPSAADGQRRRARRAAEEGDDGETIEARVVAAVRQIQTAAGADADHLRSAMRQAIAILQRSLGDA